MADNPLGKVELKTAIRYFTEVQKHLELNKPVPWNLSKDAIKAAVAHYSAPDSQGFIGDVLPKLITLLSTQSPAKYGVAERDLIEEAMYHALCIALVRMKELPGLIGMVGRIFDPKLPFYHGIKFGYSFCHGFPLVRTQLAKKFADLRGFKHVAEVLSRPDLPWPGADALWHLLVTVQSAEVGNVDNAIKATMMKMSMEKLLALPDDILKRENTDNLSSLVRTIGNIFDHLADSGTRSASTAASNPARTEQFYKFWYNVVFKCITSSSLVIKLFGYEQLNDLIADIRTSRPLAGSYIVENAGTDYVNGLYIVSPSQNLDADHYQYVKDCASGPLLTLFRCTMRNTKARWWFISQADLEKPGTDKDIDYYLHRSSIEDEHEPPIYGWLRSNAGMKVIGEDPIPVLRRGAPIIREPGLSAEQFVDSLFLQWALPRDPSANVVALLFTVSNMHREIIARAEKFLLYLIEYDALTKEHIMVIWKAVLLCNDHDIVEEVFTILLHLVHIMTGDLQQLLLQQWVQSVQPEHFTKMALLAEKLCAENFKYLRLCGDNNLIWEQVVSFSWALFSHPQFDTLKNTAPLQELLSFCFTQNVGRSVALERMREQRQVLVAHGGQPANAATVEDEVNRALNVLLFIVNKFQSTADINLEPECQALVDEIFRFVGNFRPPPSNADTSPDELQGYASKLTLRLQVLQRYFSCYVANCDSPDDLFKSAVWAEISRVYQLVCHHPIELEEFFVFLKALHKASMTSAVAPSSVGFSSSMPSPSAPSYFSLRNLLHYRIFTDFLCSPSISWASIKEEGLECFRVYFNDLEYFNSIYTTEAFGSRPSTSSEQQPIKLGITTLWHMMLNLRSLGAAKNAINLLLTAYEGLSDAHNRIFTPQEILNILFAQLETCLLYLQSGEAPQGEGVYDIFINASIHDVEHAQFLCSRCVQVLQCAIQKFDSGLSLAHYASTTMGRMVLNVRYKRVSYYYNSISNTNAWRAEKGTEGFVKIEAHPMHSIKLLKSKIIEAAGLEPNVRIHFDLVDPHSAAHQQGGLLDSLRLYELHMQDNQEISCSYEIVYSSHSRSYGENIYNYTVNVGHSSSSSYGGAGASNTASGEATAEHAEMSLGQILADDFSKFDVLLTLCQCVGDAAQNLKARIWEVLMAIPTQSNLLDMVQNTYEDHRAAGFAPSEGVHVVSAAMLNEEVWGVLSHPSSVRVTYLLQIVDMLLRPAPELELLSSQSGLFRDQFVRSNGVESVLAVLLKLNRDEDGGHGDIVTGAMFTVLVHILQYILYHPMEKGPDISTLDDSLLSANSENIYSPPFTSVQLKLSETDNKGFLQQLLFAAHLAAQTGKSDMVENTLFMLTNALKQNTMSSFLTQSPHAKQLVKAVLANPNKRVREMAYDFTVAIGRAEPVVTSWVVEEVLSGSQQQSSELFASCKALLAGSAVDLSVLGEQLRERLLTSSWPASKEGGCGEGQHIHFLELYAHLLRLHAATSGAAANGNVSVDSVGQVELIQYLLERYLFFLPAAGSSATAFCDTSSSRSTAFQLLLVLASSSRQNLSTILDEMHRLVKLTSKHLHHTYNLQISYDVKNPQIPQTGLKNQGCTCYLNCCLQLLYASSRFRDCLLNMPIKAVHRTTLHHIESEQLIGRYILCEVVPAAATTSHVMIYLTPWRLGKVIGFVSDTGTHRVQYFHATTYGLDEVANLNIHSGRFNKETGRVRLVPEQFLPPPPGIARDTPEYVHHLSQTLSQEGKSVFCLSEKDEGALRVIEQLQRTFLNLLQSSRKYYDPRPLVEACKTLNLNFNIYHQNDAVELFDQLLDRIEMVAKNAEICGTDYWTAEFNRQIFGGTYITQKIPADCPAFKENKKECGHYQSSRQEAFLKVELQIRNKDDIYESLREMVAGEVFDGENKISCDVCQEKKTTTRFSCLNTLPNVLLMHLKRFDLDFNTFETVKLNTRMAFPRNINLFEFTREGIELKQSASQGDGQGEQEGVVESSEASLREEDCEYILRGVMVHAGVAQGGHYYSFAAVDSGSGGGEANVNGNSPAASTCAASSLWCRFDDDEVTRFDPEHIPYHCFGGSASSASNSSMSSLDDERTANALMLLYEKVRVSSPQGASSTLAEERSPAPMSLSPAMPLSPSSSVSSCLPSSVPSSPSPQSSAAAAAASFSEQVTGTQAFEQEIREANLQHLLTCYMVDPELHVFLTSLVAMLANSASAATAALLPKGTSSNPGSPAERRVESRLLWTIDSPNLQYCRLSDASPSLEVRLSDSSDCVVLHTMKVVTTYIFDVLLHIRERPAFRSMGAALRQLFDKFHFAAYQFIFDLLSSTLHSTLSPQGWFAEFLHQCPDAVARGTFVQLCGSAFLALCPPGGDVLSSYNAMKLTPIKAEVSQGRQLALLALFMRTIVDAVFRVPAHVRTADEVFCLLRDLVQCVPVLKALQHMGMVSYLSYFIVPDLVSIQVHNMFERSAPPPPPPSTSTNAHPARDYSHLHQSILEAIAALLGVPTVRRVNLLQEKSYWDNELTPEAREALTIIFDECCRGGNGMGTGTMDAMDITAYLEKVTAAGASYSTNSSSGATSGGSSSYYPYHSLSNSGAAGVSGKSHATTVRTLLERYSPASDNRLHLDGWLSYQADTASYTPRTVWRDLHAFGFQNDLTRRSNASHPMAGVENLPSGAQAPLEITDSCRSCLSHLVFYETGLLGCEAATRAIAIRVCTHDATVSCNLLGEALEKLYSVSCENSWVPHAATMLQDFLRMLVSIDDNLLHGRLETIMLSPSYGLATVILQERTKPSVCRANDYNRHYLLDRYRDCVQDLLTVPGVSEWLAKTASEDTRIGTVRGMLKLRPGSQLAEDEEVLIRGTTVRVEGAGAAHVNGDYTFDAVKCNAGYYSRTDGGNKYTLYKCSLQNGGYQWFLSITPPGMEPGTKNDIDFYFASAKASDRLPPLSGWEKISATNTKNPLHVSHEPSPRLTYVYGPEVAALPNSHVLASSSAEPVLDDSLDYADGDDVDDLASTSVEATAGIYPTGLAVDSSDEDESSSRLRNVRTGSSPIGDWDGSDMLY